MASVRFEISLRSAQNRNQPVPFRTAGVTVRRIEADPLGWPYPPTVTAVVNDRRVTRETYEAVLATLHESYPGCSHKDHPTPATWLSRAPARAGGNL